jgi:hypothetical protein
MKSAFAIAALVALSATAAQAEIRYPDQMYTVVTCRDANLDLVDAGTAIVIRTGGFAGITLAEVSENTFHGPVSIGSVLVHSTLVTRPGAPTIYRGTDFELVIEKDAAPLRNGMLPAHFKATVGNNDYDQDMACEFWAHTL